MLLAHPLTPFVDRLTIPPRRVFAEPARLAVRLEATTHRFHRDLAPSGVWTYDGHLPGPTIEVRRGVPLEIRWDNRLSGTLPVVVTVAPSGKADGVPVQCLPGRSGGDADPSAAALTGFSVVHLHGAVTHASSDGWAENLAAPGQATLDLYPNEQRAAMLWYHDHVMGVTRFKVYAGLAGLWIVHLDSFQVLGRQPAAVTLAEDGITATGTSATVDIGQRIDDGIPHALDDNELGLKDTVRVNANEVVDIAVRFSSFAGRYMYHCHILEHEDRDMMRPFVIMPAELMPFMDMNMAAGHGEM